MIKRELYNAQTVLHNIFNVENDNIELAFSLIPLFREINQHIGDIEKAKQDILKDTATKDEEGKIEKQTVDGVPKYVLEPSKSKEFEDRFNAVLDEAVILSGTLPLALAKEMRMTIAELTAVEFLFEK